MMETLLEAPPSPDTPAEMAKPQGDADGWERVIKKVRPAMVTLHLDSLINLDRGGAGCAFGSGFCVDAEMGLLLTNRHVVTRGPSSILVEWGETREEQLGTVSSRHRLTRWLVARLCAMCPKHSSPD